MSTRAAERPDDGLEAVVLTADTASARVRPAYAVELTAGHFPGDPLLPGARLVALMSAAAARLVAPAGAPVPAPSEIVRCAFRRRVRPGDPIDVTARRAGGGNGITTVEAEVRTPAGCAARAVLRFGVDA